MPKHSTAPDTNDDEEYVIGRLAEIGIRAEKIASSSKQKSCDLRAADDQARYLIEVKARRSDEAIARTLRKEGATGLMQHPMGFSPSTEKTMRLAVEQLDAIAGGEGAFKLIWYCINPQYRDGVTLTQQVIDTAYGGTNLVKMPRMGETSPIHCFFFHRSVFGTHPQLSGIVVDAGDRFTFLLNPFGARLNAFRETPLFRWFDAEPGGVVDVHALEADGAVLIADCDIDRRNTHAVLTYLKKKYALPRWGLFHLPMIHHSGYVAVPMEALSRHDMRAESRR